MPREQKGTRRKIDHWSASSALGYIRVSTEEQVTGGVSLAAQEERIRAYCVVAGLELVELIREEGVSGAKPIGDRPEGARLLQLLGPNRARHLVAMKLDRLFRDAADALNQTRRWDNAGIALHLVDMGGQAINTASAMGRMFLTMTAAFAELERNLIAERTTTAMRHMKAKRNVYARTPMGFQRVGDSFVEDRGEMVIIQRIRDLHTFGRNYSQIAADLNADQVPTKRGGRWFASTVRYILRNDLYDQAA